MIQEDKDETVVFCAAVGNTDMLVDFFATRGQMSDAVLTAQVACEGLGASGTDSSTKTGASNGWREPSEKQKE